MGKVFELSMGVQTLNPERQTVGPQPATATLNPKPQTAISLKSKSDLFRQQAL